MIMDGAAAGAATLAMTQAVGAYTFFLPKISEVRKAVATDQDTAADVRVGEIAAGAITIGIGLICSSIAQSNAPLVVSLIMAAVITAIYESVLAAPANPAPLAVVRNHPSNAR